MRTVEQLLDDADAMVEGTRSAALDAIRQDATEDGVTVTVNLDGKLVGLELSRTALARGATELADRISRLVTQASADAAQQGMAVLADIPAAAPLTETLHHLLPHPPATHPPTTHPPATDAPDSPPPITQAAW